MRRAQRSRTADSTAAARAAHRLYDRPVVFDDPYALQLTSPGWRHMCRVRFLHWLVLRTFLRDFRPIIGQIISRARYAEDRLAEAIAGGIDQYVIIGAGFDSFALRRSDLAESLRVFELDHPATQEAKRRRLGAIGGSPPKHVEFVPVDFEQQSVADALAASSFARERRAFFSWMGTVSYLTREAIFGTLGSVARFAAPGSELVFDFVILPELLRPEQLRVAAKLRRFTRRRGEPLVSFFDPRTFPGEVARLGYTVRELLSPPEQDARYFADRSDDLRSSPGSYFLHLGVGAPRDGSVGGSPPRGSGAGTAGRRESGIPTERE